MYQSQEGGKLYVPLDHGARVIRKSTPRLAKLIQSKYIEGGSGWVQSDLVEDRGIELSRHFIQDLSQAVSNIMIDKEMQWSYALPDEVDVTAVKSVSVSRDGTTTHIIDQGWRETMCGSLMLNNEHGTPLHCIYVSTAPEKGKTGFDALLDREIHHLAKHLGDVPWQGLADGAPDNWAYLNQYTQLQTLDYYHASGHLNDFAKAAIRRKKERKIWVEKIKSLWLDQAHGAHQMLEQMQEMQADIQTVEKREEAAKHFTYFTNQVERMNYFEIRDKGYPIGSGVIEAACKHIVKQRLAQSGMRWTINGADEVLIARALKRTPARWNQFWNKLSRYGFN